ncbi:crotonase/enoyl-CoA hydratase family protein [Ruegeria sediminis]|uniref:Crotonase/enoyl-CoA hydratase family protein n=1 Tax=Ruegeria sediminis TaxID=2583820 RepID=A0ABY2WUI7_9RHOB|nr:crotonase/enoyl-CoA hydratase family protein [Ruegeria sediminis]TMV05689.1 crotonase/enoyl-CoA hydratase family protein [Ruegeria sediminis]
MTDEATQKVLVTREGAVLVVTINRPESRNAIDRETSLALAEAMDQLDSDPALSLAILTGAGDHFCAGMDLKAFVAGERVELPGRGLAGMTQSPPAKPLIAAVEGYALAGGFEIALACDLIVASETAQFGLPEAKRGLIAGSGGLVRLPERVPRQIAMECALTGRMIPAAEAERWGLINRLSAPGAALDTAKSLAAEIAKNAPMSLAASKEIVAQAGRWSEDSLWPRQNEILERVIASRDAREGATAFAEKRPPVWKGR